MGRSSGFIVAKAGTTAFLAAVLPVVLSAALANAAMAAVVDQASLTADFAARDALPESKVPPARWSEPRFGSWGPHAGDYPPVTVPSGNDPVQWQRARILAVAKKYIGLPYQHHHIPAWSPAEGPGLDCSNYTAWVYNYGLGMKFNSDVHKQADSPESPGRRLNPNEPFLPGDLLYIMKNDRSEVSHVVIFIDERHVIDSHDGSVQIREFKGWYRTHLSHARRIIE
ncbi:hypothetical protein BH11CYA1_BH11CYA1_27060 [soil metagenome]